MDKEGFYKVFLTGLVGTQNSFDLFMIGDILIDWIVDPSFHVLDSDSFEDQDFVSDQGTSWVRETTGGTLDISNERASDGSWSMRLGNARNTEQNATLAVDTTGKTNISVSFYYAETGSWEASDCFYFDWYNGTSWKNELTKCNDWDSTFLYAEYNLSSDASNNSNFKIRFIHNNPTNGASEELWIDNIKVKGYANTPPTDPTPEINSTDGISDIIISSR